MQHLGIQSKNCISAKDNNITRAISTLNMNFFVRDCANITPNKNVPRQFSVSTNLFPLLRKPSFLKEFSATAVISPYFWVRASESQNNVSKEKEKFVNTVNNVSKGKCGTFVPKNKISLGENINIVFTNYISEGECADSAQKEKNDILLFDNELELEKDTGIDGDIGSGLTTYIRSTLSGLDQNVIGPITNSATNEPTCNGAMLVSIKINKWLSKYYNYDLHIIIPGSSIFNQKLPLNFKGAHERKFNNFKNTSIEYCKDIKVCEGVLVYRQYRPNLQPLIFWTVKSEIQIISYLKTKALSLHSAHILI